MSDLLTLPRRGRGRQTVEAESQYQRDLASFCEAVLQFRSRLDFEVSARGWGYTFEGEGSIQKNDIDLVERLINECRKNGHLPLNICAVDEKRAFENVEHIDDTSPEEEAQWIVDYALNAFQDYRPFSFWSDKPYYLQTVVEKTDLKSLYRAISHRFHIPIANAGGWGDLHVRASMMERFRDWEAEGKQCVLLYCGDHDPGGLCISSFLRSNMAELSGTVGWSPDNLIIDRFGLNRDYIDAHGLVWIENLITNKGKDLADPKHPDHFKPYVQDYIREHGKRKVEGNALLKNPEAGRDLYRQTILKYIDPDAPLAYERSLEPARETVRAEVQRLLAEDAL